MKKILSLINKTDKTVIGVLSGTSVDAVDTVLVKINGSGNSTKIKVIDFESYPVRSGLKNFILKTSDRKSGNVEDICRLNFMIGHLFADSVKKLISKNKLNPDDIDLIGSHGQTIYHYPFNKKLFGLNSKSTLQIGDPSVIANETGITTVGDFRTADIAVNGDGAPLVPYLDYILFSHKTKNRVFINIGGISNVTYLKKSCRQNEVIAFDCGPGNMIIDYLMKKLFDKKYDKDGRTALSGNVDKELFKIICSKDKFFRKKSPKSTGREYYGNVFADDILKNSGKLKSKDIIATVTKFTAYSIYHNLRKYDTDEIIVSGGGARNKTIIYFLKELFGEIIIKTIDEKGINPDNKEAVLFAVLANEIISGNKTNMTSVSGSYKNVYLGKICPV